MPFGDTRPRASNKRHSGRTRCSYCGIRFGFVTGDYPWRSERTWDHIIPRSKGGKLQVPSCGWCNREKDDKTVEEWLQSQALAWREERVLLNDTAALPLHQNVLFNLEEQDAYRLFLETGKRYDRNPPVRN